MTKIYYAVLLIATFSINTFSQTACGSGRYAADTFTAITTTSDIAYGAARNLSGNTQTLTLDFYAPDGDTETARPLIIWAHGGSFFAGSKTEGDVVALSQRFAKKGFVCASINYRLGFTPFDSSGIVPALLRAVQDMKAAVRFFYKDKLTANQYKIDTNNIFIGGSSAGAITALHAAYLDKSCEINSYIPQAALEAAGGIEGYSGSQCYSSKVKGVINLCGALGKYGWIEAGDVPFCSMHGTTDGTVLYGRGKANPGIPMLYLDGSRMLHAGAPLVGVNHSFYTWYGKGHVPYAGTSATALAYMDTTVNFVRDYLISRLGCTDAALLPPNTPAGTATPYAFTTCTTNIILDCANSTVGINDAINLPSFTIYPNPASEFITIETSEFNSGTSIQIMDLTGKIIKSESLQSNTQQLDVSHLSKGLYFIKIQNNKGLYTVKKITVN